MEYPPEMPPEVVAVMEARERESEAIRPAVEADLAALRRNAAPPGASIAIRCPAPVRAYVEAVTAVDRVSPETLRALPVRERALMRALLTVALGTLDEAEAS